MERTKKLTLSKETLRSLDDDSMRQVVGGAATVICLNTTVCQSGVCKSVACLTVVCIN